MRLIALALVPILGCQHLPRGSGLRPDAPLERAATSPVTGRWAPVSGVPALEDIFLRPGIQGVAPRAHAVSADGRWLLFEHRALERGEGGRLQLEQGPALRIVELSDAGPPAPSVPTVLGLLPAPAADEKSSDDVLASWSHAGHRLLLARGRELFLHDPATSRQRRLVEPGEAPWSKLSAIRFERDDAAVAVSDGKREWRALLPPSTWPAASLATWQWQRTTPAVLAPLRDLKWSDDRSVAVRFGGPAMRIDWPLPGPLRSLLPLVRHAAARALPHQVVHLEGGRLTRAVELEGLARMPWCEDMALSPDGRFVLGLEMDRRRDPEATLVPDYLSERVTHRKTRGKWAEDGPSPYRIWIWDTASGARRELEPPVDGGPLGEAELIGPDWWVIGLGWAPQPEPTDAEAALAESRNEPVAAPPARAAFARLSADHRELELWTWSEGELRRVWHDRDERWIGGPVSRRAWSSDGRALVLGSESTEHSSTRGRAQLFTVDAASGAVRQLTEALGEVAGFDLQADGGILVQYSDLEPAARRLGWLSPEVVRGEAEAPLVELPQPDGGWNSDPVAGAGASAETRSRADARGPEPPRVVFRREELGVPGELWVSDANGARPVTNTVPGAYAEVDWIRPVRFRGARTERGEPISAHVFLPRGVELAAPERPRPTIVFVHGAGYLQNVTESMTEYAVNLLFHSRLAERGYVVVDVDYRGSAGYGHDFRTDIQYHMGGTDLDDIHAVLDALVECGLVDARNVGLYGGSYGGFLTMMALFTAPERWSVGAALRSVTDWRTYNPWYTQPRLGRPSTHPEAYRASSPIDHVDGLEDPLLVLHGMVDDNVFAQDSIRLIECLIQAGKDFDAMLYPSQNHGFTSGESWLDEYRRIEEYLTEHLARP